MPDDPLLMAGDDELIKRPDDLSAQWLTSVLPAGEVASFSVNPIGTGQMSDSFRVGLTYAEADGAGPESVVLKVASSDPTSLLDRGWAGRLRA